jgi:hypothetical protein
MARFKRPIRLVLLAVVGLGLLQGCPRDDAPPNDAGPDFIDAGVEDAGEDAGALDAGHPCLTDEECEAAVGPTTLCWGAEAGQPGLCVAMCVQDDDCAQFEAGLRCEDATGRCIPARGCTRDSECPPPGGFDPDDYCELSSIGCRCVSEANASGFDGVCRRRRTVCTECTDDGQCGDSQGILEPAGRCRPLQDDHEGPLPDGGVRKFCFQEPAGTQCGCGMILTAGGLCIPQNGNCHQVGCAQDADCPNGAVCNTAACLCEARCAWNFDPMIQALNPPGCHPELSCWVDPENLEPQSRFFGAGRCRPPCQSDAECQAEDPRLVCRAEQVEGGESNKRCRPAGDCMDGWECALKYPQPPGSLYLGYCRREDFSCQSDCRTGLHPTRHRPYADCITGYKCVHQDGQNLCVQQTCLELGGARIACNAGQYCCGEDKDGDGLPDPCPSTGLLSNQCYRAPEPPFCTTCQTHADCQQYPNPSGSPLPALCIGAGPRPGGGAAVNICAPATWNDFTLDDSGVPRAALGCPAKYAPTAVRVQCTTPSDCGPSGMCEEDLSSPLPGGGYASYCMCLGTGDGSSVSNCPNDPAGVVSVCRYAPQGALTSCLQSMVCVPSPGVAYLPPEENGCGL